MLPIVLQMFALVRDLAARRKVTEISITPRVVQRHLLAPLTCMAGVSAFRPDLARTSVAWAALVRALPDVIRELQGGGIRVAPIKGVSYATGLYGIPAERPMTDVDLLVAPSDVKASMRTLTRLGFLREPSPRRHHATTWVRGGLVLDLHANILAEGRNSIDLDAVWNRVRPGWPDGAWRLDPVDELVFHWIHMARNRLCGPLIQVVDSARLVERVGAAGVAAAFTRARAWKVDRIVQAAAEFSTYVCDGDRAPRWWSLRVPAIANVIEVRQPGLVGKVLFDLATTTTPGQLIARARELAARLRGSAER